MANATNIPPVPPGGNTALQGLWPQIYTQATSQNPPVDPTVMYNQAIAEGGINSDGTLNISSTGAIGVMQLEPGTASDLGVDPYNNTQNIAGAAAYMATQLRNFNGDYALALSAYNSGPGNVRDAGGVTPASSAYVNQILSASGRPTVAGSVPNSGGVDGQQSISPTASTYTPLDNNSALANQTNLTPLIVVNEGLDVLPWYYDSGLITGNPRLRQEVQPVVFQVLLRNDAGDFYLSTDGSTGIPLSIELNASMKSTNWTMKHNYHHQRTRTAHHITLWGLHADVIEGSCTTGVFMNQLGLTDYYSTRTVDDKLKQLVTSGYMFKNVPTNQATSATATTAVPSGTTLASDGNYYPASSIDSSGQIVGPPLSASVTSQIQNSLVQAQNSSTVIGSKGQTGGSVSTTQVAGDDTGYQLLVQKLAQNNPNFNDTSAFRVAAQDAFAEFLALFKMNGSVWFWNQTYQDGTGNTRDWAGVQAWSPSLGANSSQINARNNDIVTRGGVVMSYRNYTYQGYFKSLQWQMDAQNPFQWTFSFTFQVEKTIGLEYLPT